MWSIKPAVVRYFLTENQGVVRRRWGCTYASGPGRELMAMATSEW